MRVTPTRLELRDERRRLVILWSDGQSREYSVRELREACPCATCRERRKTPAPSAVLLPVLSAAEARPLVLSDMRQVGSYAYSLEFSDGHDTGIFTLEALRELGRPIEP